MTTLNIYWLKYAVNIKFRASNLCFIDYEELDSSLDSFYSQLVNYPF